MGREVTMSGRRWIELRDVLQLLVVVGSDVGARLDERRWPDIGRRIGWWADRTNPGRRTTSLAKIAGFFPDGLPNGEPPDRLLERIGARLVEETILMRRLARQPEWRPRLTPFGAEDVDAAARDGGVLLWVAPQPSSMLLVAIVGHDRGWPMRRLSIWSHGVSGTRFAAAALNPLWRRVEDRYAQRIVIEPQGREQAKTRVVEALGAGGVLQIQAVDIGRRLNVFPLLGGRIRLALGAPKMAERAGVPLFGVTVRREADGSYVLEFEKLLAKGEVAPLEEVGKRFVAQLARACNATRPTGRSTTSRPSWVTSPRPEAESERAPQPSPRRMSTAWNAAQANARGQSRRSVSMTTVVSPRRL